jgi:hypothetical protein
VRGGRLDSVEQKTALTAAEMCADCNNGVTRGKSEAAAFTGRWIFLASP